MQVTKLNMALGSNCTTDIRGITWRWRVWWQGKRLKKRRLGCSRLIAAT